MKLPPYTRGRERLKEETDHSRLVGGKFNKQANFHTRLVLDGHKTGRSLHPHTRIQKVYMEAFMGFSHTPNPDGLTPCYISRLYSPLLGVLKASRTYIPRAWSWWRTPSYPGFSSWVKWWAYLLDNLLSPWWPSVSLVTSCLLDDLLQ